MLWGVRQGDVGAAVKPGELTVGDVPLVRGKLYKVMLITRGGMPREVFRGADLVVFNEPFTFNQRELVVGAVCLFCLR